MSEDRITVVFGARVGELIAGIAEAKEAVEGFAGTFETITGGLSGIAEAVGIAFAVDKIKEFAESIGELALKTEVAAAAIGVSTEEISKMSVEMELLTGKADLPTRAFESLASNIVSGSKRSQAALSDLAISQADAAKMTTNWEFALRRLAQAFNEGEPGMARTADFAALIGRRFYEQLIPVLKQTQEQFDETSKAAEESGAVMTGPMLAAFNEVHKALNGLAVAWDALTKNAMALFARDIVNITHDLTTLVNAITNLVKWLGDLGKQFDKVAADVENAGHAVNNFISRITGLSSFHLPWWLGGFGFQQEPYGKPKITTLPDVHVDAPGPRHLKGPGTEGAGKKASDDRLSIWRDELRTQLETEEHFFNDSKQEELDFWRAKLATVSSNSKEDVKLRREVHTEIFNLEKQLAKQTEQIRLEEVDAAKRFNDEILSSKRQHLQSLESLGKISAQQRIGFDKQLLGQEITADEEYFHRKEAAAAGDQEKLRKLGLEEALEHQKLVDKMAELDDQAAIEAKRSWTEIGDTISHAVDTLIMGVIQGTQTIGQAFRKLGESILEEFVNLGIKKAVNSLMNSIFDAVGGQSFGGWLGGLFGGGAAAAGGATAAGGGGLFSWLPALFALERGGVMPSAAGGWVLPSFQSGGVLSMLHQNEMVLPSHISQGFQDMFAGGGRPGGATININAVDPQHGAQYLIRNADTINSVIRQSGLSGGWSPRSLAAGGRFP